VNSIATNDSRDSINREKSLSNGKTQGTRGFDKGTKNGKTSSLDYRRQQLCATASIITTVSEDDELSENSDITKL
jgi:hypothetical protein